MRHLLDVLLTTDPVQRTRLVQAAMVGVALSVGGLGLLVLALVGVLPAAALLWALLAPAGALLLYLAIRSGWSRRFEDPSLTMVQIVGGAIACALAYGLAGVARGGFFLVLMVVLMGAMLSATPWQMRWGSVFAAVALGLAMLWRGLQQPGWPWVEAMHFGLVATMLPAASVLTTRLAGMRQRSRRQQQDLEAALVRIRELATRDELTGLINRRAMLDLMALEHRRSLRSGRPLLLAQLDIDHFKPINDQHGHATGDRALQAFAGTVRAHVRDTDVLARWGGEEFVLMLCDTQLDDARDLLERVRLAVEALEIPHATGSLRLTVSAGLALHLPGDTVVHTLERADQALYTAKALGRNRWVVAPNGPQRPAGAGPLSARV